MPCENWSSLYSILLWHLVTVTDVAVAVIAADVVRITFFVALLS